MKEKERNGNPPVPQPGDRVLWIRFWAFGDTLEAAAEACNFKRRFPETRLTFLTRPEYAELFQAQPYIDGVISGRKSPFAEWRQTLKKIRDGSYDWLVSDQSGGKTAMLARFSRAPHRIGSCSLFPFGCNYQMSLRRWEEICGFSAKDRSLPSMFAAEEDREAVRPLLEPLPERRLLALIGAGNPDKMWPADRWIGLLRPLAEKGWGIALNGYGPAEEAIGRQIEEALSSQNVLNLVGTLNYRKMLAAAHFCTLALGNDTGPLHLAALGGVPAMGLFGRSTSRLVGLTMPWFRELCAEDHVGKQHAIPLKALPVEPVALAFDAFAEEFLPRAFEQRRGRRG